MNNVEQIKNICNNISDTYEKKNADYGNSFDISLNKYGVIAALTRMSDKFNRIENLILNKNQHLVKDEAIEDTLLDLATYSIMTLRWLKEHNKNK